MAKRSYRQFCGLAAAMDVVGERWAMLVVRDLAPGPRRFSDLFAGLPGIATDVLAERLRSLEAAGAVRQRQLRHPVPANVYELTERGVQLAAICRDLARWGQELLPPPGTSDHRIDPRWALQSMAAQFGGGLPPGAYELVIDGDELHVDVTRAAATVRYGPSTSTPRVRLTCSARTFFRLARDPAFDGLPASARLDGDLDLLRRFFQALPLTVGRPARSTAAAGPG